VETVLTTPGAQSSTGGMRQGITATVVGSGIGFSIWPTGANPQLARPAK
jgi:hypothetical protein